MQFHLQIIDFVAHVVFPLNQVIVCMNLVMHGLSKYFVSSLVILNLCGPLLVVYLYLIEIGRKHVLGLTFVPYLCWYED